MTATVHALGDRGDGLVKPDNGPKRLFFLPGALQGERVRLRSGRRRAEGWTAVLEDVIEPSPDRVPPPCPHATRCGGCDLQHMAPEAIARWKGEKVARALAHRGLTDIAPLRPTRPTPPGTRRRLTLALRGRSQIGLVGFHARESHRLVDTPGCLLPTPRLSALMAALRLAIPRFLAPGEESIAVVTDTDTGLDILMDPPGGLDLAVREALAAFAQEIDLARLSFSLPGRQTEPVVIRRPPSLTLGGVSVQPPPGAFLQPSRDGEEILVALVAEALADVPQGAPLADLFSGLGTFALPLAAQGFDVLALDAAPDSIAALGATDRVRARVRDLFRDPLAADALDGFAAVVLDPPRAGGQAQALALAARAQTAQAKESPPPPARVVMVSCAPGTLARDLRILVDGGYAIDWVQPVDQFPWSHHVEVVARLSLR